MADKVNLLLKRGLYANLPAQGDFVDGALYFTTDEGGLYLGLSEGKGVRVQGSVLYFSTLEEFYDNVKPPYSTDVLYFIEKDKDGNVFNALMRWNGTTWVQINATAEAFQSALNRIKDTEDKLDAVEGEVDGLTISVNTLTGLLGVPEVKEGETVTQEATGLFAQVKTNTENIATNAADIAALTERMDAVDGEDGEIANLKDSVKDVSDRLELLDKEDGKIAEIEQNISDIQGSLATKAESSAVEGIDNRLEAVEGYVGKPAAEGQDASGIFATLETLATKDAVEDLTDRVDDIDSRLGFAKDGDAAASGLFATVDGIDARLTQAEEDISKNAGDIKSNTDRISDLENALGLDVGGDTSVSARVGVLEGQVDDLTDRVDAIDETIKNTLATKAELSEAQEALDQKIDNHILAANAMRYMGIVNGDDKVLPTSEVSVGDTYMAAQPFKIGDVQVYAGDLIVAEGAENAETGYIETVEWKIVNTGYIESHENSLEIDAAAGSINLLSHLDEVLSSVKISSTSANLDVQFDATNNAISLGMVWDTF